MAEAKAVKARFVGDPRNPNEVKPDVFGAFGATFEGDKFVEVPAEFADKVRGNSHFEVQGEKARADDKPVPESTTDFASRVQGVSDREALEQMLEDEKRPAARSILENRIAALPQA